MAVAIRVNKDTRKGIVNRLRKQNGIRTVRCTIKNDCGGAVIDDLCNRSVTIYSRIVKWGSNAGLHIGSPRWRRGRQEREESDQGC